MLFPLVKYKSYFCRTFMTKLQYHGSLWVTEYNLIQQNKICMTPVETSSCTQCHIFVLEPTMHWKHVSTLRRSKNGRCGRSQTITIFLGGLVNSVCSVNTSSDFMFMSNSINTQGNRWKRLWLKHNLSSQYCIIKAEILRIYTCDHRFSFSVNKEVFEQMYYMPVSCLNF